LEARPGTYALVLVSGGRRRVRVGRLGWLDLEPGCYVYVGSARGPGGVCARVARHARATKGRRWHIDYLRPHTRLARVWYSHDARAAECEWARSLAEQADARIPLSGFGASDCRCPTHLLFFAAPAGLRDLDRRLRRALAPHGRPDVLALEPATGAAEELER
jgi:Uri superfamily endonuclease